MPQRHSATAPWESTECVYMCAAEGPEEEQPAASWWADCVHLELYLQQEQEAPWGPGAIEQIPGPLVDVFWVE